MNLKSLKIKGFRNLKGVELNISEAQKPIIFLGKNGQGKTNILEAIFMLALTKSFRAKKNEELIGFENEFCQIEGRLENDKELQIIMTKSPSQKSLKINGVKKKITEFMGVFNAILFTPEDLSHFSFSPNLRRRYLDITLSQIDSDYLGIRMKYHEVVRQRNALLKSIQEGKSKETEGIVWDEQLVDLGYRLTQKRQEFIDAVQKDVIKHYHKISKTTEDMKIIYNRGCRGESQEEFDAKLKNGFSNDIRSGCTRIGPHRDDIIFEKEGRDMGLYASRGEWRSLILALKLAEVEYIEKKIGKKPVLLLDDVFSELDEDRQKYLMEALTDVQVFITTTHEEYLSEEREVEVVKVAEGSVE